MRRTTICRSKAAIAIAFATLGLATPSLAQNPPSPPQQPQAAQPAPSDTGPATPLSQLPATHLVGRGETLWGLAQQYFGDPLLWPELYRLNTDVVEDPHWIFPGEELRITQPGATQVAAAPQPGTAGMVQPAAPVQPGVTVTPQADTTQAAPQAPAPSPVVYEGPTIFSASSRPSTVQQTQNIEIKNQEAYRALRPGEIYSAAFLTENRPLATGRLLGTVQAPNIERLTLVTTAMLYSEVAFDAPAGDTLHPGDLVLTLVRDGEVRGWGAIMRPTGLLRVESVDSADVSHHVMGRVAALYREIHNGQAVLPISPLPPGGNEHPVAITDGVQGHVLALVGTSDLAQIQDEVLIDKGAQDSVRLGDIFQISGTDRVRDEFAGTVVPQAEGMVVNVQQQSCTVKLISVRRPDVRAGSIARVVRRMPS